MNVFLLEHHGFENVLHIQPFRLPGEFRHLARVFFHRRHARIAVLVNAMAEAHHDAFSRSAFSIHSFARAGSPISSSMCITASFAPPCNAPFSDAMPPTTPL